MRTNTNIDLRLNSRDFIGVAAVWKLPEIVKILLFTVFVAWLLGGLVPFVVKNQEKQSGKMERYSALVQKCMQVSRERYGYANPNISNYCHKWANSKEYVYENL